MDEGIDQLLSKSSATQKGTCHVHRGPLAGCQFVESLLGQGSGYVKLLRRQYDGRNSGHIQGKISWDAFQCWVDLSNGLISMLLSSSGD